MTLKWLIVPVVVYGAVVALVYVTQRLLQYFPEGRRTAPSAIGLSLSASTANPPRGADCGQPVRYWLDTAACRHSGFGRSGRDGYGASRGARCDEVCCRSGSDRTGSAGAKEGHKEGHTVSRSASRAVARSSFSRANTTTAPRADIVKAAGVTTPTITLGKAALRPGAAIHRLMCERLSTSPARFWGPPHAGPKSGRLSLQSGG